MIAILLVYGPYVLAAYALAAVVLLYHAVVPFLAHAAALREVDRARRQEEARRDLAAGDTP
jgi:heme exporter protein CcmD